MRGTEHGSVSSGLPTDRAEDGVRPSCGTATSCRLERSLRAAGQARAFVAEELCDRHARLSRSAVMLAASEFATHGALLGTGPLTVSLRCDVTAVRLSVSYPMPALDVAAGTSRLQLFDEASTRIIEGISRSSGVHADGSEWLMWCLIPTGYLPGPRPR